MSTPDKVLIVLIATPPSSSDALARALVTSRAAACVNILPARSVYTWDGALQTDTEELLIAKTTAAAYAQLEECVRQHHPYDVPEIIATDVERGSAAYLDWVRENTGAAGMRESG